MVLILSVINDKFITHSYSGIDVLLSEGSLCHLMVQVKSIFF